MDLGIKGRRAIVCASSKGLGRACATALAAEGVHVTLTARGAEALAKTAADIRKASPGVKVTEVDKFLQVEGMTTDEVGDLAAANHITIHELFAQRSSLEEAFMEMTRDSVEYHAQMGDESALDPAAMVGGTK